LFERVTKILRIQEKLIQTLGREPEIYEIALDSGFLTDEDAKTIAKSINSKKKGKNLTTDLKEKLNSASNKVAAILILAEEPISLDRPLGEDAGGSLGDVFADTTAPDLIDISAQKMLEDQVDTALRALSERERQVLELRFGIGGGDEQTLEEVSTHFYVTRERIRQIEAKALRKLRHPTRSRHLREYLS
jgi:RNA polymerase primary sigma factor